MYSEKRGDNRGFAPYVAPNIKAEPNKEIIYDDVGNIKAIIDREKYENNLKQAKKDEFVTVLKKAVKIAILFFIATAAVSVVLRVIASIFG